MSKFQIGDVVYDTINVNQALSYPTRVIREVVEINDGNSIIGYSYDVAPINSPDEIINITEDCLTYQYHDAQWEEYFTESVGNGLPAWRGELYNFFVVTAENYEDDYRNDTIPTEYMRHILDDHSIYERIDDIIKNHKNDIMVALGIPTDANLKKIRDSLKSKILSKDLADTDIHHPGRLANKVDIRFTEKEQLLADIICDTDKKDIYRLDMTSLQIMQAIKEAYENAYKTNNRKVLQTNSDRRTGEKSSPIKVQKIYRGYSVNYNLTIEFWFNFDLKIIETAYPIRMNNNAKKH